MADLKGSKTEKNLWAAFAGESQARNKYSFFASVAKKEGYEQIAGIFLETAEQEKEHAKLHLRALGGIGDTVANLKAAAEGEGHEWTDMYPGWRRMRVRKALLKEPARYAGRKVGLVLCGGNIDPLLLAAIIERGMVRAGRLARIRCSARDTPGALARITALVAEAGDNIEEVHHQRAFTHLAVQACGGGPGPEDPQPRSRARDRGRPRCGRVRRPRAQFRMTTSRRTTPQETP